MTEEQQKYPSQLILSEHLWHKVNMAAAASDWSNALLTYRYQPLLERRSHEEIEQAPDLTLWFHRSSTTIEDKSRTKLQDTWLLERRLHEEIEQARNSILCLQDNWDGQGSLGYSESVMDRAINFMKIHVAHLFADSRRILIPKILPSGDGSIDLHWKEQAFELLVNIPATDEVSVSFYGEDFLDRSRIKGTFDRSSTNKVLANWLTEASE